VGYLGQEEVTLVGHLAGLLPVAAQILNGGWIYDINSGGFGLGGHLAVSKHRDAYWFAPSGGQANLFLDPVRRILQINVPEGESHLD
jgi:hypothetical protein